jgi:hypothetical protein
LFSNQKEKKMIQFRSALALGLLLGVGAMAQEARTHVFNGGEFFYLQTEAGAGRVVKGSPYSAQGVTQSTQTLPDGNHIQRTITSSIARDSEGRTRREQTVNTIGALSASGAAAKSVMIHDPVAGTTSMLEASSHVAHVNHETQRNFTYGASASGTQSAQAQPRMRRQGQDANVKTEDLGTQVMEGLSVQGQRMTHTIPAGQVGNERAIETVTETWYSQDLHAVVMSKSSDPRSGDSSYKLTNISRAEPDAALFQVPADYTVTDNAKTGPHMMRRGAPAAPKQ